MLEVRKSLESLGYPGYTISNLGNVYNARTGKMLKPFSANGYQRVNLCGVSVVIHRLVAKTFISNPDNKAEVNHIDCDTTNNTVSNLEWCTRYENLLHQVKMGSLPGLLQDHQVHEICKLLENGVGCTDISKKLGVSHATVFQIKRGAHWTHISNLYNFKKPTRYNTKLSVDQVHEICRLLKENRKFYGDIAAQFGCTMHVIAKIATSKNWRSISSQYW